MSHLPSEVLTAVRHLIQLPAMTSNRYQLLKDTLVAAYGKTPSTRTKELLDFASCRDELVDPKPNIVMLYILDLAGASYDALSPFRNT